MTTTTRKRVTKRQAQATLAAVRRQFAPWLTGGDDGPVLVMDYEPDVGEPRPAIVWESGPFEWAMLTGGGVEEEFGFRIPAAKLPAGVWTEPYNSFILAIYPA